MVLMRVGSMVNLKVTQKAGQMVVHSDYRSVDNLVDS